MSPAEPTDTDTIEIVDNSGRRKVERVAYTVENVFGQKIHVTEEGLQYARDSLQRKRQTYFLTRLEQIPQVLSQPDIVIRDTTSPEDTVIFYRQSYDRRKRKYEVIAIIVKVQGLVQFLYNVHPQESGKVKGCREIPKPEILYLKPGRKPRDFGL
jgi:hypothetical protein